MVGISPIAMAVAKRVPGGKRFRGTFLDKIHVNVAAGNGGMGNQKYGGIGGKGGDVYMEATKTQDLKDVVKDFPEKRIKAGNGGNSIAKQLLGQRGSDVVVKVPCGVRAVTDDKLIAGEVNTVGEKIILAKGGIGGNSSTGFCGVKGQKLNFTLELSLIADVGLLGFPNAGKSTLLRACSNAKPRIAAYPFTTVKPNVGVIEYNDFRRITMADLPGLIEGAHANFGMGHKFLRHIERTKLVLMVVDVCGFQLGPRNPQRSAFETVMLLNKELELYNPDYVKKPMALIINKMDTPGAEEALSEVKVKLSNAQEASHELPEVMRCENLVKFEEIIAISAKNGGAEIEVVKDFLRSSLEKHCELERGNIVDIDIQRKFSKLRQAAKESGPALI